MFLETVIFAMGADPESGAGSPLAAFVPLILMFAIFYFLLIRPQQKKAKEHRNVLANLKRGDNVLTNGGLYARISDIQSEVLTLEIGDNTKIKANRNYIAGLADPSHDAVKRE
ncbi:preprotein translocase subunit YajC [Desulfonatronospira sp.]|uniref:preprotein translocase subunit YajC n=1 Tax=Desulfonatronospira sp. TaxID=1962951 RepID=UPI0025C24E5A|nr:preprotein translocase subunit YajC [Desulfonatronospira sp.]